MHTYQLLSSVILEKDCYKKVIRINDRPNGPLASYVKQISPLKNSSFDVPTACCSTSTTCQYVILNPYNSSEILCESDIVNLISFLGANGYTIETELTKIMKNKILNLIYFLSYP